MKWSVNEIPGQLEFQSLNPGERVSLGRIRLKKKMGFQLFVILRGRQWEEKVVGFIIIILVLHLRLSSKLPQRRMRLCSVLEKFSFKQFFKHRKSYIRVLQTRRETVPSCWTSIKESTRANCLGGGGWHKQVTGRCRSQVWSTRERSDRYAVLRQIPGCALV